LPVYSLLAFAQRVSFIKTNDSQIEIIWHLMFWKRTKLMRNSVGLDFAGFLSLKTPFYTIRHKT